VLISSLEDAFTYYNWQKQTVFILSRYRDAQAERDDLVILSRRISASSGHLTSILRRIEGSYLMKAPYCECYHHLLQYPEYQEEKNLTAEIAGQQVSPPGSTE